MHCFQNVKSLLLDCICYIAQMDGYSKYYSQETRTSTLNISIGSVLGTRRTLTLLMINLIGLKYLGTQVISLGEYMLGTRSTGTKGEITI